MYMYIHEQISVAADDYHGCHQEYAGAGCHAESYFQ